jgi:hypothetical protein
MAGKAPMSPTAIRQTKSRLNEIAELGGKNRFIFYSFVFFAPKIGCIDA